MAYLTFGSLLHEMFVGRSPVPPGSSLPDLRSQISCFASRGGRAERPDVDILLL
jgi:hypothetical protein